MKLLTQASVFVVGLKDRIPQTGWGCLLLQSKVVKGDHGGLCGVWVHTKNRLVRMSFVTCAFSLEALCKAYCSSVITSTPAGISRFTQNQGLSLLTKLAKVFMGF